MLNKNKEYKLHESIKIIINILGETNTEFKELNKILQDQIDIIFKDQPKNININSKNKFNSKEELNNNNNKDKINENKEILDYIDEDGFKISNKGNKIGNIFEDLNYADFVIKFDNPFYNLNSKKFINNIQLERCYFIFNEYINLSTSMENLEEKDLLNQKIAFIYCLIFFSNFYFGSDFSKVLDDYNNLREKKISELKNKNEKFINQETELELIAYWDKLMIEHKKSHFKNFLVEILALDDLDQVILKYQPKFLFKKYKNNKISDNLFKYLVNKIIILKFNKIGMYTRKSYTNCNSGIFLSIKCLNSLIYERAEIDEFSKQLEVGKIDLFSLEPIDSLNRPFKLKNLKLILNMDKIKISKEEITEIVNKYKLDKNKDTNLPKDNINILEITKIKNKHTEITNLDEENFLKVLKSYNRNFIQNLDLINKDLELKQVKNKEVLLDLKLSRTEWEYYLIFTINFNYWFQEILEFKDKIKNFDKYEGLLYRLIFKKALGDVNDAMKEKKLNNSKSVLKTIWNILKFVSPIGPFIPFNREYKNYFRTYEINELHKRSYFLQFQRIRLTYNAINDCINILNLLHLKLITDFFPVHDNYILFREKKEPLFENIFNKNEFHKDKNQIKKILDNNDNVQLINFFNNIEDEADYIDFEELSLSEEAKFNWKNPMQLPIQPLRNYFGEKIGLYFNFVQHLSWANFLIMFISFIFFIIFIVTKDFISKIIMSTLIWIYSNLFFETWKRKEKLFALEFGQLDFEENEFEIPSFKGEYIRDITSNNYNFKYYPQWKKNLKYLNSFIVSVLIVCISIGTTFSLLILKKYLNDNNYNFILKNLPTGLISIMIILYNKIYLNIAVKFNFFENHKSQTIFEDSLILKLFIFTFFSTFNPFIIIAFIKPNYPETFGSCIYNGDNQNLACIFELQSQCISYVILQFLLSFSEILTPFFLEKFKKYFDKKKVFDSKWSKIDKKINEESLKKIYIETKREIDGVIIDYMQLVWQFAFLSLFSISFELSFILAWITDIAQMHFDKLKLFKYIRRPIPNGASDIGTWSTILNIIIYLSIFFNAALISFVMINLSTNQNLVNNKTLIFILIVLVLGILKIMIDSLIPDFSSNFKTLLKRHNKIYEKLINYKKLDGFISLKKVGVWMDPKLNSNKKVKVE